MCPLEVTQVGISLSEITFTHGYVYKLNHEVLAGFWQVSVARWKTQSVNFSRKYELNVKGIIQRKIALCMLQHTSVECVTLSVDTQVEDDDNKSVRKKQLHNCIALLLSSHLRHTMRKLIVQLTWLNRVSSNVSKEARMHWPMLLFQTTACAVSTVLLTWIVVATLQVHSPKSAEQKYFERFFCRLHFGQWGPAIKSRMAKWHERNFFVAKRSCF